MGSALGNRGTKEARKGSVGNRGTKEARKDSIDSRVRLRKTKARRRHRRVPSVCEFGFGKSRHEGGTEGFRRFGSSASGNRGTKEARKGMDAFEPVES
ncbi:hypothetical protein RHGRI_005963 [Rhododendron griersonianum]|uniref:Uncharacterized protein n=1 Tax=Rhododendron griersonianum TaxID=479676 RepID=A0AAV6LF81_9ERIC|nr:hypothetical protein RHGRI_005963 [Rhododendron griersonianum]